jgi:hypothetical protein
MQLEKINPPDSGNWRGGPDMHQNAGNYEKIAVQKPLSDD